MTESLRFIYGVLDVRDRIDDSLARERSRELTFAWSRWSYAGPIIEHHDPHALLTLASQRGAHYCLVQACGHLIVETLRPKGADAPELVELMIASLGDGGWLVGRKIAEDVIDDSCWLVDLRRWHTMGCPRLTRAPQLPRLQLPTGNGIVDKPAETTRLGRDLEPHRDHHARAFRDAPDQVDVTTLQPPLGQFVASLAHTLTQCQRGIFIWNLEPYDDVDVEHSEPLRTLYSVAAGFKPNAILRSHGYTPDAEVVFIDYSEQALAFRRALVEQWNGRDLPTFLWPRLRPDNAHYWLRSTTRGGTPEREELEQLWARELQDWGGADSFAEHWDATRRLRHRYVHADLLKTPEQALGTPAPGPALVWWSNAFSSVHALWHLRHSERLDAFSRWINTIATHCPQAWLLGADANNSPVGGIRAATYAELLSAWKGGMHDPLPGGHTAVRF